MHVQSPPPLNGTMVRAPMIRLSSGPIRRQSLVTIALGRLEVLVGKAAEVAGARDDAVRAAVRGFGEGTDGKDRVAAQPEHVDARLDGRLRRVVLRQVPVLVVADAEEHLAPRDLRRVQAVAVGAVGHVVAVLFQEVGQRLLEGQELAGADRQRVVDDARVLRLAAVGPVEADGHVAGMGAARVGVQRMVGRPAVVGLRGVVAGLEQHVGAARVADDEDDVALPIRLVGRGGQRRQPAQVHTAQPVGGNLQRRGRIPAAFAEPLVADGRDRVAPCLETAPAWSSAARRGRRSSRCGRSRCGTSPADRC